MDVNLKFFDPKIKSLRDGQRVQITVAFKHGAKGQNWQHSYFRSIPMIASAYDFGTLLTAKTNEEVLAELAKRNGIGFLTDKGVVITAYDLEGSAAAIAALKRCSAKVSRLRPSDPFTK